MSNSALRGRITKAVKSKLQRMQDGGMPRVLDLFSGCGGISLGFEKAGCVVVGGIERDHDAAASFLYNFKSKRSESPPPFWLSAKSLDITRTQPAKLAEKAGMSVGSLVDLLVGGPPCQAFARIGRAKLRSVTEDPEAWLTDKRANLYKSYLRYVAEFAPCALMMENVPDFMSHGGENMAEEACENLKALGYRAEYTLMNASSWGVPQHRERMILVAFHESADVAWTFPTPTNRGRMPTGYKGTRAAARALIPAKNAPKESGKAAVHYFRTPPDESRSRRKRIGRLVTVDQAFSDIPIIQIRTISRGFSRRPKKWKYQSGRPSKYAQLMREWQGHEAKECIEDHLTRYLPRDFKIFKDMKQGEQYPEMHRRQSRRLKTAAKKAGIREGTKKWERLSADLVPPYPHDKFPNKWYRLKTREPSRTLLAHLGKDGYTHIHPVESRVISVREAARLQSFPDGFLFSGSMNAMFRQIGNAVPPILAFKVARRMLNALK